MKILGKQFLYPKIASKIHEDFYWNLVDQKIFLRKLSRNYYFKKLELKEKRKNLFSEMNWEIKIILFLRFVLKKMTFSKNYKSHKKCLLKRFLYISLLSEIRTK